MLWCVDTTSSNFLETLWKFFTMLPWNPTTCTDQRMAYWQQSMPLQRKSKPSSFWHINTVLQFPSLNLSMVPQILQRYHLKTHFIRIKIFNHSLFHSLRLHSNTGFMLAFFQQENQVNTHTNNLKVKREWNDFRQENKLGRLLPAVSCSLQNVPSHAYPDDTSISAKCKGYAIRLGTQNWPLAF